VNIFRFYTGLGLTAIIATSIAYYAGIRAALPPNEQQFIWWALWFYVPLSIVMYHAGVKAVDSPNPFIFSHLSMFFTVSKLIISMILVIVFWKKMQPQSKYFIVPFMIEYFCFVFFETYFMVKIARKS
jgi:hypothetical protein